MAGSWFGAAFIVRIAVALVVNWSWVGLSHAQAERRVALVVGNADYVRAPLVNPVNDAARLIDALGRQVGGWLRSERAPIGRGRAPKPAPDDAAPPS